MKIKPARSTRQSITQELKVAKKRKKRRKKTTTEKSLIILYHKPPFVQPRQIKENVASWGWK